MDIRKKLYHTILKESTKLTMYKNVVFVIGFTILITFMISFIVGEKMLIVYFLSTFTFILALFGPISLLMVVTDLYRYKKNYKNSYSNLTDEQVLQIYQKYTNEKNIEHILILFF